MKPDSPDNKLLNYYRQWYSDEQLAKLLAPSAKIILALKNREFVTELQPLPWYPHAYVLTEKGDANAPGYYVMNPASLLSVLAIDPQPGESIADICAAPGGKSIAIAERMNYRGRLLATDLSSDRMKRLKYNFKRLNVPMSGEGWQLDIQTASAHTLTKDLAGTFDKVLVDAPCSSEAHVLADPREIKKWSTSKSTLLAKRQRKILSSAIKLLKPGGRLVYSTCAISPLENDGVLEFILKKYSDQVRSVPFDFPMGHKQGFGTFVNPWEHGMGPGYVGVMEKV